LDQAVLFRRSRELPRILRQFIGFLKQPGPEEIPSPTGMGELASRASAGEAG